MTELQYRKYYFCYYFMVHNLYVRISYYNKTIFFLIHATMILCIYNIFYLNLPTNFGVLLQLTLSRVYSLFCIGSLRSNMHNTLAYIIKIIIRLGFLLYCQKFSSTKYLKNQCVQSLNAF
jgi:hypothetical protein